MGKPSIIQKLGKHLADHTPPKEECHVMYLMAEIRKVLEHDNSSGKYPALRLYSNWCVHTQLDRPNNFMKQAAEGIENEIQASIVAGIPPEQGKKLSQFLSMQVLKTTLREFLQENHLSDEITGGQNWKSFQGLLVNIVSEQPIKAPSKRIAEFIYNDDGNGIIVFEIEPPQFKSFKFS
jgi:hypothetical protein